MKKTLLIASAMAVAATSQAVVLFNNADGRGLMGMEGLATLVRPAGGFYSELQTGQSTFGFTANGTFNMADDFTISGTSWQVDSMSVFVYQTGATAPNVTGGTFNILNDAGGMPGTLAAAGTFSSVAFTNIYRSTAGGASGDTRRVQQVEVNMGGAVLGPGTYWIEVGATTTAGTAFMPVLTLAGADQPPGSKNAHQFNAGVWAPIVMGGTGTQQDVPFYIHGVVVPEPGTFIAIGIGLAGLALARRRK